MPRRRVPKAPPPRRRAVFTIVSANYIGYAATLMQSVSNHLLGVERYIILADTRSDFPDITLAATLLACDQLGIAHIGNMQAWYTVIEFNTAIKPYVFLHLFERLGYDEACYIDPDILLFGPMPEVFTALYDHSCVLTPHMMHPLQDGREPSDLTIMKSGIYNLGFLGLRHDEDGLRLARWWAQRCFRHCRVDIAGNMFTDQRWMDLAPAFVRRPYILRHPGYNVAYWNLPHRHVHKSAAGHWQVDDERLVFFHFSGISPGVPGSFSKHQNRYDSENLGEVAELCNLYRGLVLANKWQKYSRLAYGFGAFPDGRRIDDTMRHWLARAVEDGDVDWRSDIMATSGYFDEPDTGAAAKGATLTRYMHQFWLDRTDLRAAFDIFTQRGLAGYLDWFFGGDALRQGADAAAVDAGRALCRRPLPPAADATPQADPAHPTGPAPPWAPVSSDIWAERSTEAQDGLAQDIVLHTNGAAMRIPRQAALCWERRADLQAAFDLRTPASRQDFLIWVLTSGLQEGAIDPACLSAPFLDSLGQASPIAAHYKDVPVTEGMILLRNVAAARAPLPGWRRFAVERAGRLAQALWYAFAAPAHYHWPDALAAPVRAYFHHRTDLAADGFRLNRAASGIWELRPDLQLAFPLADEASIRLYLRWLVLNGLRELAITIDDFDPKLRGFLLAPSPRIEGASQLLEMVFSYRKDLQARFDPSDDAQRTALLAWAGRHLLAETRDLPLGAVLRNPQAAALSEAAPSHHATLGLTGYWTAPSGRGEDLRGSARSLDAVGYTDYVVIDLETRSILLPDGAALPAGTRLQLAINIVHTNADTAPEDAGALRRLGVHTARAIGLWAWELERLPGTWRHAYTYYDEIWAATRFAEAAFRRDDARPVRLVPMAVSQPAPGPVPPRAEMGVPDGVTLFLFVFDYRSYAARKNPQAVLRAFAAAFPAGDEAVRLIVKTSGAADKPEDAIALQALALDPRIELRDAHLPRAGLLGLIAAADAFVSLHRSEGFGRGPAEAMLLGTPLIVTGYSGSADYATPDCALLVDYDLVPVRPGAYPGAAGQSWAEASTDTAARHMRWVHEHPDEARALGKRGRDRIESLYHPTVIGGAMLAALGLKGGAAARRGARNRRRKALP